MAQTPLLILAVLLATTVVLRAETQPSNSSLSSDTSAQGSNVFLKVRGHSGKIIIGWKQQPETDDNRVEIDMDSLQEVDASGAAVKPSGSAKHSFNTFANQDFTFSTLQQGTIFNLKAQFFTFSSQLKDVNSSLTVSVYIMGQDGSITLDGETTPVKKDSVKFSVSLTGWSWCSASAKTCQTDGAGVILNIAIKSKDTPTKKAKDNSTGDADVYSLGYGTLLLSKKIQVDGLSGLQNMAAGYPQVTTQGSKQVFSFRFPKFTQSINYDPTVVGEITSTSGSSNLLATVFAVVLTTLLSRLLAA